MKSLSIRSYAKINISLNVLGKTEDGYHNLDMIMVPLELHDSIIVNKLDSGTDTYVTMDDYSIGVIKTNLGTFAIEKLEKEYGFKQKFRVFIHKNIPIRSGLGGGSSNCAFTIKAVNTMLKLNMSREKMIEVGKTLGADVPFFVDCVPSRARGIGDILDPITIKNNYYVLLVKPNTGCATKEVFNLVDNMEVKVCNIQDVIDALADGDDDKLAKSMYNALEESAISLVPEIKAVKEKLFGAGLKIVQMSGSGSTVFALSTNKKELIKAASLFNENNYFVELTKIKK